MPASELDAFRWAEDGAAESQVHEAELLFGGLPSGYLTLMREHDGGEGFVGDGEYLRLWPMADLVQSNLSLDAERLVPGVMLFGTNGGGEVFGVHVASETYASYPMIGLSVDTGKVLGQSWEDFLAAMAALA